MQTPTLFQKLNGTTGTIVAAVLVAAASLWFIGCQATVDSLLNPGKQVTRAELQSEWQYYTGIMKARTSELDQKDALRQLILDQANIVSQTGTINPAGVGGLLVSVLAIGFGLDQRRKAATANSILSQLTAPDPIQPIVASPPVV